MIDNITAYISVPDCGKAIAFYERAFGGEHTGPTLRSPDGKIIHTEIRIGSSTLMMADENPDFGNVSPATLVRFNLEVVDADAVAGKAIEAGAEVVIPVDDQFYGYRSGRLKDPRGHTFGYLWILSQKLEDLTEAEMQKRCDAMFSG